MNVDSSSLVTPVFIKALLARLDVVIVIFVISVYTGGDTIQVVVSCPSSIAGIGHNKGARRPPPSTSLPAFTAITAYKHYS